MSGTRSHSPAAPATEPHEVVLVAFGSLSDAEALEEAVQDLTTDVAAELPDWTLRGATLGAEGAIARAFDGLSPEASVFPLMMSDGWLMRRVLPDALKAAGRGDTPVLTPLGLMPAFRDHCADMIRVGVAENGHPAEATSVVLAAHGSARGPRPAACTRALAEELARVTGVRAVVPGYLEEAPFLADALRDAPEPAICLPCFATNAWHVTGDVPQAVREACFTGLVLPAAGTVTGVEAIIARDLIAAHGAARAA